MPSYIPRADFGLVIATPEISYFQRIGMDMHTLEALSESGRPRLWLRQRSVAEQDTLKGFPDKRSHYDSSSLWTWLLSFMTVFGNRYCICFLCARHYGPYKDAVSELIKLVLPARLCVHVFAHLCMDRFVHLCLQVPLEARGWHGMSPVTLTLIFWDKISLTLELPHAVRLAATVSSRAPPVCLPVAGITGVCCGVRLLLWVVGSEPRALCLGSRHSTEGAMHVPSPHLYFRI